MRLVLYILKKVIPVFIGSVVFFCSYIESCGFIYIYFAISTAKSVAQGYFTCNAVLYAKNNLVCDSNGDFICNFIYFKRFICS